MSNLLRWIHSLPPYEAQRESGIAIRNLDRIANHIHSSHPYKIDTSGLLVLK